MDSEKLEELLEEKDRMTEECNAQPDQDARNADNPPEYFESNVCSSEV